MIEVILREDVKSLGKAGALVRVKPGYARNFLLPRGLAYEASEGNKKRIAAEQKSRETKSASERVEAAEDRGRARGAPVTLSAKAGEGDRLFGSITAQDIADKLASMGHHRQAEDRARSPDQDGRRHRCPSLHPECRGIP